jgi:hypothetical protein
MTRSKFNVPTAKIPRSSNNCKHSLPRLLKRADGSAQYEPSHVVGSSISRVRSAVGLRDLMTTYSSMVMMPSMRSRMACSRLSLIRSLTSSRTESVHKRVMLPIEGIRRIIERWEELLKHYQDANGQVKQPRWAKCWEMWQELSQVIHQNQ